MGRSLGDERDEAGAPIKCFWMHAMKQPIRSHAYASCLGRLPAGPERLDGLASRRSAPAAGCRREAAA